MNELEIAWAGGTDRRGGGEGPLVVLLHGFGAPATDLVSLHRVIAVPSGVRYAFPAGLVDLSRMFGGDARAWWFIDLEERMARQARGEARDPNEIPEGMDQAAEIVAAWLEKARGSAPLVLGGFSQGAMLALEVALRLNAPPEGLALLSSTLLAAARQTPLLPRLAKTPIVQSHGRQDTVLPFALAEKLHAHLKAGLTLQEGQATPTFIPFNGGHEIPNAALEGLTGLFARAFG